MSRYRGLLLCAGVLLGLLGLGGAGVHLGARAITRFAATIDPAVERYLWLFLLARYARSPVTLACGLALILGGLLTIYWAYSHCIPTTRTPR